MPPYGVSPGQQSTANVSQCAAVDTSRLHSVVTSSIGTRRKTRPIQASRRTEGSHASVAVEPVDRFLSWLRRLSIDRCWRATSSIRCSYCSRRAVNSTRRSKQFGASCFVHRPESRGSLMYRTDPERIAYADAAVECVDESHGMDAAVQFSRQGFNIIYQHVRSVTGIGLLVDNTRIAQCPKNAGRVFSLNGD